MKSLSPSFYVSISPIRSRRAISRSRRRLLAVVEEEEEEDELLDVRRFLGLSPPVPPATPPPWSPATAASSARVGHLGETSPRSSSSLGRRRPVTADDFKGKVYVAPLTTVGNLPFRRVMKDQQADITVGEMALVGNLLQGRRWDWALTKRHVSEDFFGIQVAVNHKDMMRKFASVFEQEKWSADFVDLNCGCPIDGITNRGG